VSDPRRLIDDAGSPEARLLAAALDEPPPADLLARTLAAVGAAPAAGAGAAGAVAGKAAGGGLLGAVATGALAGVLTVGGYGLVAGRAPSPAVPPPRAPATAGPTSPPPVPAAPPPSAAVPPAPPPASAARPTALAIEIELLDGVRHALDDGDPARARSLLDRYAREAPRGQLAREAAKLRAEVEAARANP
jgi:hypothetical protein